MSRDSSKNHFKTINRRVMYLTDRIARHNAEEKTAPIFDILEREALIWAVDTIRDMAQRLLNMGQAPNLDKRKQSYMIKGDRKQIENPYLLMFIHLERYGILNQFSRGELSYNIIEEIAKRFDVSPKLLWKLSCKCMKD